MRLIHLHQPGAGPNPLWQNGWYHRFSLKLMVWKNYQMLPYWLPQTDLIWWTLHYCAPDASTVLYTYLHQRLKTEQRYLRYTLKICQLKLRTSLNLPNYVRILQVPTLNQFAGRLACMPYMIS